jgi:hypothetical protein
MWAKIALPVLRIVFCRLEGLPATQASVSDDSVRKTRGARSRRLSLLIKRRKNQVIQIELNH